jgi:hypothetical protein
MFVLDLVGRFAAHDVASEENNLLEGEITMLEPRAVLYGPRLRTLSPSNLPSTTPTKSFRKISFCGTRHISTTSVALHLTPKQSHFLQELDNHCLFTKQAREKYLVPNIVFPQHRTSV